MSFAPARQAPAAAITLFELLASEHQSSGVTSVALKLVVVPSTDLATNFEPRGGVEVRLDSFGGRGRRAAGSVEGIATGPVTLRRASVYAGVPALCLVFVTQGRVVVHREVYDADSKRRCARTSLKKSFVVSPGCSLAAHL